MLAAQHVATREALPFRLLRGRTRRDMRNHRKLYVIDGAIGYAGSQNIVAKDFRPAIVNRELVARVTGPVVASLFALAEADWSMECGEPPAAGLSFRRQPARPCSSCCRAARPMRSTASRTLLVWQLHEARERVLIVTPYFIPDDDVLGAMRSGGDARSGSASHRLEDRRPASGQSLAILLLRRPLVRGGCRCISSRTICSTPRRWESNRRLAIVGSSNVDLRSFQLNEEASLLIHDAASIAGVNAKLLDYLARSETLTLAGWRARPPIRKFAENIARLVNSLL